MVHRILFTLLFFLLAACAPPEPGPAPTPGSTPPPAGQPALQTFTSREGGFSLTLPAGWVIGEPQETALGVRHVLGPEPLDAASPAASVIYYASTDEMFLERAIAELCASACDPEPEPVEFSLDGRRAWRAVLGGDGMPARAWTFVDNGDVLVFFTLNDPDTMQPLEEVIAAMTFSPIVDLTARSQRVAMILRQALMQQLQATMDEVTIVSVTSAAWPDGCLGLAAADEMCTQAIVPGFEVVLEANGERYVYRTDQEGMVVRLAQAPAARSGDAIVHWQSPDFPCQEATIGLEGLATGLCGGALMPGKFISPVRPALLAEFARTYAAFAALTPAGQVVFNGRGPIVASTAEQRMIAEWARQVVIEAEGGRAGASYGLAFTWGREGGIAGFCDELTVYISGEALATTCGAPARELGRGRLTAGQLARLYEWLDTLALFEFEQTDPATADAMTLRVFFSGNGQRPASAAEQEAILAFGAELFAALAQTTSVHFVQAHTDLAMYAGPGQGYDVVGELFGGQTALVTGVNLDQTWWRVICPDDTVGDCWLPADPALTTPITPPGTTGLLPQDETAIYSAVIRRVYTRDHTFGQSPNFPIIYLISQTDDGAGMGDYERLPAREIAAPVRAAIVANLADLPAQFEWVASRDQAPLGAHGEVSGNGAIITVGNIRPQEDGAVHVAASIYIAMLAAGGQTYVLEQVAGDWTITGTTGPIWIS